MDDEYQARKFTKEDLDQFNNIEEKALTFPLAKESLEYLLNVLYKFENYVVEKICYGNQEEWRLKQTRRNERTDILGIVDRIEEYGDELSMEERLFILRVKNLITHQMRRLHVDELYPKSRLRNRNVLLLAEHKPDKAENKKERIVWLSSKEVLQRLINEWKGNHFIEESNSEKVMSNFCDKDGVLFTAAHKEKIRWCKNNTELVTFIGEMAFSKFKCIAGDEIWAKVCKCFLSKDGKEMKPGSLAVTYQNCKPKNRELILNIIKTISEYNIEK
ncbi:MAG: hypothetical protein IPM56_10925 [Ignavibacteriales bacterium]|nr:MAG: hypothetical protein IPM56_10925 [Ignavibacteriales bacterium]